MTGKNQKDFDDLTRIEDLPPLEHPPLPQLPQDFPEFTLPKLPESLTPPSEEVMAQSSWENPYEKEMEKEKQEQPSALTAPETFEIPAPSEQAVEEIALDFEEVNFTQPIEKISVENDFTITELDIPPSKVQTVTEKIFEDVKEEMETFVLKHVPFESYPSFSLYLSEIHYGRQRNSIKLLLKEYGLMQSDTEKELVQRSIQLKHLLIPRISEYAAIYFANKLEGLNIKIQLSPSEDLTTQHELWDKGPVTSETFHHRHEEGSIIKPTIFISQHYSFVDKSVRLLGIVLQQTITLDRIEVKENFPIYFNRLQELKEQAQELQANAIVGLTIQQIDQEDVEKVLFLVTGEAAIIHEE